jgi:hypothetical protein
MLIVRIVELAILLLVTAAALLVIQDTTVESDCSHTDWLNRGDKAATNSREHLTLARLSL